MATLRDVADLAAVSVATASRVLNGSAQNHPVSSDVQSNVRIAAETLGYTPSAAARALRQKQAKIIGVIASDILDPYFAEMARGIEIEAGRFGYVTILANANRDPYEERAKFSALREHQAAGIVFCGSDIEGSPGTSQLARDVNRAIQQGTSVVALAPRGFDSTKIIVDNHTTAYKLTEYLISLGHRDIVFLGGIPGLVAAEQRIAGYQQAMYEANLVPRLAGIHGMSQETGAQATANLVSGERPPDALIGSNDEVAVGALVHLWTNGFHVPDNLSVAGIGGTRGGALFGLTTMVLPLVKLGESAARYIAGAALRPGASIDPDPEPPPFELRIGTTTRTR